MNKPEFVKPNPTRYEGHSIYIDDGYRPNCEYTGHTCEFPDYYYYPKPHEAGWKCMGCNEELGRSLLLDKVQLAEKVHAVLAHMATFDFVHVSSGEHGRSIEWGVMGRCVEDDKYDQLTIMRFILELLQPGHSGYWQGRQDRPKQADFRDLEDIIEER